MSGGTAVDTQQQQSPPTNTIGNARLAVRLQIGNATITGRNWPDVYQACSAVCMGSTGTGGGTAIGGGDGGDARSNPTTRKRGPMTEAHREKLRLAQQRRVAANRKQAGATGPTGKREKTMAAGQQNT
jgi:hypothetical protein